MALNTTSVTEQTTTNLTSVVEDPNNHTASARLSTTEATASALEWLYLIWNNWNTIYVVVFVIAVIGNTLTFCVCMKKVNRKKSFMLYLAALAVCDTLPCIQYLVVNLNYVPTVSLGSPNVYCKLYSFIFDSSRYISSWLIVAISLERTVATKLPHLVTRISNQRFGIKTISVIIAISLIFNSDILFGWVGITDGHIIWCYTITGPYSFIWTFLAPARMGLFYSLIPGAIIILCNTVMIKAVFASSKVRTTISESTAKKNRELLIIGVLISMSFVILTSPYPLFLTVTGKLNLRDYTDVERVLLNITRLLVYINGAINIFLYVASGSRFRQQLKELFPCHACRQN